MTTKDKLICVTYGLIALVALPATWINNIGSSLLSMLIYAQNDCWQGLEPKIYYR